MYDKNKLDEQAEREGKALKKLPVPHHTNGRGRVNHRDVYGKEKFDRLFVK